ncbi:MAG TPA: tetratricopeptide repeat protein [Casimicrobiaceae bacterium]|nr:tetratricopeptide repeat protein [Casimicrobiaceae bacterium]
MAPSGESRALAGLERLLAAGKDSALLRFGLGSEHFKGGDAASAAVHFQRAIELDPGYSAAWKMLGKALLAAGRCDAALAAWNEGIAAAARKGDKQAMKEMQVFARRLAKGRGQE